MTQDCLTETRVVQFVEGSLPADGRRAVEAHLASCGACSDLVTWAAAELRTGAQSVAAPTVRVPGPPAAPARRAPLAAGARVDRYQILGFVGRGGMGEVYAAYHPDLDRRIALKIGHDYGVGIEERQARLLREARSIARLSHPNVVPVYDAGTAADRVYVAMEFIEGPTLPRIWYRPTRAPGSSGVSARASRAAATPGASVPALALASEAVHVTSSEHAEHLARWTSTSDRRGAARPPSMNARTVDSVRQSGARDTSPPAEVDRKRRNVFLMLLFDRSGNATVPHRRCVENGAPGGRENGISNRSSVCSARWGASRPGF